jgi:spore germination protein GerM
VEVRLYWVADGRLASEPVSFAAPPSPSTLVTLLERGVPPGGVNQGLRSALSGTDAIRSVELQEGTAVVEVRTALTELPERDQLLAVAQIVASLTSSPTTDAVEFRLDGRLLDVPTPDGTLVRRPLRREDYASLLS